MMTVMRPHVRPGLGRFAALSLIAAPGLFGCQDYLFERVCAEQILEEEQTFAAARPRPADILFIVDNSGSMREEQENLANNFDLFINQIAGAGDYRIAVITTDQTSNVEATGLAQFDFSNEGPYFPRTVFSQAGCMSTNIPAGCFRGPDPSTRVIDSDVLGVAQQVSSFQANVQVGTCGSGVEQGLRAMRDALQNTDPGECNASFLRDDANLVLIFVSDEDDTDDTNIDDFVDFLGTVKGYDQIRAAAIVGYADGDANDCRADDTGAATVTCGSICQTPPPLGSQTSCDDQGDCNLGEICFDPPSGPRECRPAVWDLWNNQDCSSCSVFLTEDCCLADAGRRYETFVEQLETRIVAAAPGITATGCRPMDGARPACLIDSVCQESFGETLVRIARDLVIVNEYSLTPPAEYPPGVRARLVGGRFGADGIDLVPASQDMADADFVVDERDGMGVSLRIVNPERVPRADEEIEIFYVSDIEQGVNQPEGVCPDPSS